MVRNSNVLVSIVVTTHKRNDLLREALTSVLRQTYPEIECIVVDDAGEAETRAIVGELDPDGHRLKWYNRATVSNVKGGQASRNAGFRLSRGELVMFLDDDDLLAPECVNGRVEAILAAPDADACVGQCRLFQSQPHVDWPLWRDWSNSQDDLLMFLESRVPWQTTGPLWRRKALERVGPWDEALLTGWDYEFHIRALARGLKFLKRDVVDYFWRVPREDSYSGFDRMKQDHRLGYHILAFVRGVEAIDVSGAWTPERKLAAWQEAVQLAVTCRIYGGDFRTSIKAVNTMIAQHGEFKMGGLEVWLAMRFWSSISGKVPSLIWLNRRGYKTTPTDQRARS